MWAYSYNIDDPLPFTKVMVVNMAALEDTYRTLFGDTIVLEGLSLSQRVSTLSKTLLQKCDEEARVLVQLSIYRKLFTKHQQLTLGARSDAVTRADASRHLHGSNSSEYVSETATYSVDSLHLSLCGRLLDEKESVVEIMMVDYLTSDNQFTSFAASKALTSFLLCVADFKVVRVLLCDRVSRLLSLDTWQTHVALYYLQALTELLKGMRKHCAEVQRLMRDKLASLLEVVKCVLKHTFQMFDQLKESICGTVSASDKEAFVDSTSKEYKKWIELTIDAFLSLLIETVRFCHHASHIISSSERQEVLCHNLPALTSFLYTFNSMYILKQLVHLHHKLLVSSLCKDLASFHGSLMSLFQSSVCTKAVQSWLRGQTATPSASYAQHDEVTQTTDHTAVSSLQSTAVDSMELGASLESNLIGSIVRKGALLLLKYSALVLAADGEVSQFSTTLKLTGLEQLLSTVLSHFNLTDIQKFSLPSVTSTGRRQLLHVLSEQDSCLIEGLSYCCDISVQRPHLSSVSPCDHPVLSRCLELVNVHRLFVEFLSSSIFFDHSILIDYYISPETSSTFKQFLLKYFSQAVKDWTELMEICGEIDTHNEVVHTDSTSATTEFGACMASIEDISESTIADRPLVEDLPTSCDEDDSLPSSDGEHVTLKRPKLDLNLSPEGHTPHLMSSLHVCKPDGLLTVPTDRDVVNEGACKFGSGCEKESESVYRETTLDKLMDCLTQFKYSLQRLHSSQLLRTEPVSDHLAACSDHLELTASDGCSSNQSITYLLEQLEDLYEALGQ